MGKRLTKEEFINRSNIIHNNRYDYVLVDYKNNSTKIKIKCPSHGIFEQIPQDHLKGCGCSNCKNVKRLTKEEFINRSNIIHDNKYDYSLVEYKNSSTKVKIICPIHGMFEQIPSKHLIKQGCPKCKKSKGEKYINNLLKENNINFEIQKSFKNCKNIKTLQFDFYLPEYNICIEFDGEQHYKSVKYFGGERELEIIQKRDKIKNEFCKNNNIKLIRITYKDDINEIINTNFKK